MLALVVAACAGGSPAPARPARSTATGDAWSTMSWERRHDVMTFTVLPNMGRLFQREYGKPDPDLTCTRCHGKDAEAVGYKMPHGLPALDPTRLPDASSPDARVAKTAKFMAEQVTPQMAELLGVERFTCFGCHPRKE